MSGRPSMEVHSSGRFTLRRACPEESELAYRVKRAALAAQAAAGEGWDDANEWPTHQRRFASQEYYLLEEAGAVVGIMAMVVESGQVRFNQFFVLPSHQGKGLGTVALRVLADEADRRGLPTRLDVKAGNHRAIALYRRFGYREVERSDASVAMVRPCKALASAPGGG